MSKLSCRMVRPILESMYDYRKEMVPCFIGDPGIGKTQGLYEFAKDKGVNVVTFILSNTVPSEVSGIRMPDKESKRMEVFDDMRMASLKDGDILFFDEILEAPPMLWSACLTLIQDRIMASGRKLPDVFIVAASNKVTSPGIIPASTRDRFQFIELEFNPDDWCDWFYKKYRIMPTEISKYVKGDSSQYNILTPRRIEKLYTWLVRSKEDEDSLKMKLRVIDHMFDPEISRIFKSMVYYVPTFKEQMINALVDTEVKFDFDLIDDFSKLSAKQMLDWLQSMDEWPEIRSALASTKFIHDETEEEF